MVRFAFGHFDDTAAFFEMGDLQQICDALQHQQEEQIHRRYLADLVQEAGVSQIDEIIVVFHYNDFADIADELIDAEKPQTALKILEFGLEMFPDAVPLLMGKISAAITMQDFDLMREVLQSLRELALETDNFDVLEAISALEMILTFQNTLGGLFGYDDDDWYDEPF